MKADLIQGVRELTMAGLRNWRHAVLLTLIAGFIAPAIGQPLQLVSVRDPSQGPPAGGSGDSATPIISPDGRYVLFASTANNSLLTTNDTPIPARFPAPLNVFLRDRTNGTTALVSVNLSGTAGGNGDSLPMGLSTNGQYAVFESVASDLIAGDTNNATDVFVRDMVSGTTLLVSVSTNGQVGNGASRSPAMTPDGRYVAFVSAANNIVGGDTNRIPDVFVRDLQANVTTLVSVGARTTNTMYLSGGSDAPDISVDGRFVAFYSSATNLVPGVPAGGDVYVRDLAAGTTVWASTGARAAVQAAWHKANASSFNHALSADGQFVAYEASVSAATAGVILRYSVASGLTDLVHTNAFLPWGAYENIHNLDITSDGRFIAFVANTNSTSGITTTCIQLWDAASGSSTLVSGDSGNQVPTNSVCDWPVVDDSGRFVAFASNAGNLVSNSLTGEYHLYLRDTQTGGIRLLDADTNGIGSLVSPAAIPRLSAQAGVVAFECGDSSLVPNDCNRDSDVFVRDLGDDHVELISARHPDLPALNPNGPSTLSASPVSSDGRFIAFVSGADNLVPNDTNGCPDIFVRDMLEGTNLLVSVATNGGSADFSSSDPSISGDGRYVAFTSSADNLVMGDTNKAQDVFVRDLQSGTTVFVSVSSSGSGPGNGASYSPVISSDGRYVLFRSVARNLVSGSFSGYENLFVRDLQIGTNYALTYTPYSSSSPVGSMTPNGRFVAFYGIIPGYAAKLYLWDSQLAALVYTNAVSGVLKVGASPDGTRIAYAAGGTLYAVDRAANTNWTIGPVVSGPRSGLRFSGDGRFLAYAAPLSGTNQVYLYDFQTATALLVSRGYSSGGAAFGASDSPDISADGRFVTYVSAAADIVPGDTNGVPDVFLYDQLAGATTLLSASRLGNAGADNRSLTPVLSGDGQTLVLESWGSDLVAGDFNYSSDVFAFRLRSSGSIPVFQVTVLAGTPPGPGCWFTWPVLSGKSYRVQFKTSLSDANWQDFNGLTTLIGQQGFFNDPAPGAPQRFYRILAF
jgi:Tol biopolymer transport system component